MALKSVMAARFSIERLVKSSKKVFLWTFTFKELLYPKEAMKRWHSFTKIMARKYPLLGGVRVTEWHPGEDWGDGIGRLSHGVHIHLVTNMYLDIVEIRTLTDKLFGRIHVIECKDLSDIGRVSGYLAKYLSKGYSFRHPLLKGARLWSNWANWEGCKVLDVTASNGFSRWFKEVKFLLYGWIKKGDEKCTFDDIFCDFPEADDLKTAYWVYTLCRKKNDIKGARFRYFRAAKLLYDSLTWDLKKAWNEKFNSLYLTP